VVVARVLLGFGTCAGFPAAMHLIRPAVVITLPAGSTSATPPTTLSRWPGCTA
jgi:hypothetical protein